MVFSRGGLPQASWRVASLPPRQQDGLPSVLNSLRTTGHRRLPRPVFAARAHPAPPASPGPRADTRRSPPCALALPGAVPPPPRPVRRRPLMCAVECAEGLGDAPRGPLCSRGPWSEGAGPRRSSGRGGESAHPRLSGRVRMTRSFRGPPCDLQPAAAGFRFLFCDGGSRRSPTRRRLCLLPLLLPTSEWKVLSTWFRY